MHKHHHLGKRRKKAHIQGILDEGKECTKAAYVWLFSSKAIAYEVHIYFGYYYQFQARSVQFKIFCESRSGQLFEYEFSP